MSFKGISAVLASVATIALACEQFTSNYSIELHLVPIWGVDEELPERLR